MIKPTTVKEAIAQLKANGIKPRFEGTTLVFTGSIDEGTKKLIKEFGDDIYKVCAVTQIFKTNNKRESTGEVSDKSGKEARRNLDKAKQREQQGVAGQVGAAPWQQGRLFGVEE